MADARRDALAGEVAAALVRRLHLGDVLAPVVRELDLAEVLAEADLDAILAEVDVNALLQRIDLDALIARIDADALFARVDLDPIIQRVVDRAVETGAIQRAIDRTDLGPALERAGLADIVAGSVGRTTLDTVRRRILVLDAVVERITGAVLRQRIDEWPAGPTLLVGDETGPLGDLDGVHDGAAGWDVSGQYVGPFGRILATALDVVGATTSWTFVTTLVLTLLARGFGLDVSLADPQGGIGFTIGLALWFGAWFLLPLEVFARTPAMSVLGMRVVTAEGGVPSFQRILGRSVAQLPSVVLLGIGYLATFVDRRRRTLHDRVAGTAVVWDWGNREATIASPLGRWAAGGRDVDVSPAGGSPRS